MGVSTKIDWCDSTWNPVTGCLHGCEYCYARRIAERFGSHLEERTAITPHLGARKLEFRKEMLHVLDKPMPMLGAYRKTPYPFDFEPTLFRYKMGETRSWKEPRTIFVCSMADLFGKWVPDEWIEEVFQACESAPWHRYMFLTKNPGRYLKLAEAGKLPIKENFWYGSSTTTKAEEFFWNADVNTFVSIEPILEPFTDMTDNGVQAVKRIGWIIVGAETGNRKGKVIPDKSWVIELKDAAEECGVPIFMKESLRGLMGDDFRQEFPWDNAKKERNK